MKDKNISDNQIILAPDLFTSLTRTPWAGRKISQCIKSEIVKHPDQKVGESWEVSTDPEMPSKLLNSQRTLAEIIASHPEPMLSKFLLEKNHRDCQILIKIINAETPLSLQVHPRDNDPHLKINECGKPESWLILDADPGAGVYFGFSKSQTKAELQKKLEQKEFSQADLQFVPVQKFDYFDIPEGVPHVVAPGLIVFEPQRILPHKSGKTYRMWDWNRKYSRAGELDLANGSERELHINESLALIDPENQVGPEFGASLKKKSEVSFVDTNKITTFPRNNYLQTHILDISIPLNIVQQYGYGCLTCIGGTVHFPNGEILSKGMSAFIPHKAFPLVLIPQNSCELLYVQPGEVDVEFH